MDPVSRKGNVTQMVNCVIWVYDFIPTFNHYFMHLMNTAERTIRISDNIRMAKMRVRDEVQQGAPSFQFGSDYLSARSSVVSTQDFLQARNIGHIQRSRIVSGSHLLKPSASSGHSCGNERSLSFVHFSRTLRIAVDGVLSGRVFQRPV